MKKVKLVTSASLVQLIETYRTADGNRGLSAVLGRAVTAIYNRQTADEQDSLVSINRNGRGFTAFDAKVGTLTAEYFKSSNGWLLPWQIRYWLKITSTGYPRICRYAKQLNEVAEQKAATKKQTV